MLTRVLYEREYASAEPTPAHLPATPSRSQSTPPGDDLLSHHSSPAADGALVLTPPANKRVQIVALSASLRNPRVVARWLGAELASTTDRCAATLM